jgi:hypothetical protein
MGCCSLGNVTEKADAAEKRVEKVDEPSAVDFLPHMGSHFSSSVHESHSSSL